jgi:hypothetical protein
MHGGDVKCIQNLFGKPEGSLLEDLGVDGKIAVE